MFRAVPCPSSEGQIVLLQPLVSSLCKRPYSMFTESDDIRGCNNTICPPEDEHSTARNMLKIIM